MKLEFIKRLSILGFCLLLSACACVVRNPVPEDVHGTVTVLGRGDLRHWGEAKHPKLFLDISSREALEQQYGGIMNQAHMTWSSPVVALTAHSVTERC